MRCPNCGSDRPGQHYADMCVGDATLRRLDGPDTSSVCGGCGCKRLDANGRCDACGARKGQAREPFVRREMPLIASHMYPLPPGVKR